MLYPLQTVIQLCRTYVIYSAYLTPITKILLKLKWQKTLSTHYTQQQFLALSTYKILFNTPNTFSRIKAVKVNRPGVVHHGWEPWMDVGCGCACIFWGFWSSSTFWTLLLHPACTGTHDTMKVGSTGNNEQRRMVIPHRWEEKRKKKK